MTKSAALVLSLLLAACAERPDPPPSPPPSAAASSPVPEEDDTRTAAPIVLRVSGPSKVAPGDEIDVTIRLRRNVRSVEPIDLAVTVPNGVRLVQGASTERIQTDEEVIVRTLHLKVDDAPGADLVVTADVAGVRYGAHAIRAYRFGRAAPSLPAARLPSVGLNGGPRRE